MTKETEDWLTGLEREGGMSPAAVLELRQHLSHEKADQYVKGSALRQSDYSRNMGEVQRLKGEAEAAQAALTAKEEQTTRYATELGQWKAGAEGSYKQALADREKAEATAARAVARLKSSAAQLGLSEEDMLKDLETVPAAPKEGNVDLKNYVKREEIQQTAREAAVLEGILSDLAADHQELFGTRLRVTPLVQEAIAAGKSVEAYYNERYKVAEKRKEVEAAEWQKKIDTAVAAKEAELRSSLPGNTLVPRAGDSGPLYSHKIFNNKALMESNHAADAGGNSAGVSAAVAAFQAGTHRGAR